MSSKDAILKRLRAAQTPFGDVPPVAVRRHMVPLADASPAALRARFTAEVEAVSARIHPAADDAAAVALILSLVGEDTTVMAWDFATLPDGLDAALAARGIGVTGDLRDTSVRVGITGVDVALAATGSLVIPSGAGKPRAASLLPPVHVAVVREAQIIPDLETYFDRQRAIGLDSLRAASGTVIVTGSSRTADIGQELILGAHGPVEVHVVLIAAPTV